MLSLRHGRTPSMDGSTDVEYLHNATLETLENLIAELTDERFPFDYIQTSIEDKAVALSHSQSPRTAHIKSVRRYVYFLY